MATATQIIEKIPVTTYEEKVTGVTLTLTMEEADILRSLLGECRSGGPTTPIFDALRSAGAKNTFTVSVDSYGTIKLVEKS